MGTVLFNLDNGLQAHSPFVPAVPAIFKQGSVNVPGSGDFGVTGRRLRHSDHVTPCAISQQNTPKSERNRQQNAVTLIKKSVTFCSYCESYCTIRRKLMEVTAPYRTINQTP